MSSNRIIFVIIKSGLAEMKNKKHSGVVVVWYLCQKKHTPERVWESGNSCYKTLTSEVVASRGYLHFGQSGWKAKVSTIMPKVRQP